MGDQQEKSLTSPPQTGSARTEEWFDGKDKVSHAYLWFSHQWKTFIWGIDCIPKVKDNLLSTLILLQVKMGHYWLCGHNRCNLRLSGKYGFIIIDCTSTPSRPHGHNQEIRLSLLQSTVIKHWRIQCCSWHWGYKAELFCFCNWWVTLSVPKTSMTPKMKAKPSQSS